MTDRYTPIADYGLVADCHSAALVSRDGSIDWCCMPRFDSGSSFGRLLGWDRGGHCSVAVDGASDAPSRRYVDDSLVLETTFRRAGAGGGEARLTDCFTMREGGALDPHRQLLRVFDGVSGEVRFRVEIVPRFDYGEVRPWIRREHERLYSAIGGDDGIVIWTDAPSIEPGDDHDLLLDFTVHEGERVRLSLRFAAPHELDWNPPQPLDPDEVDKRLDYTLGWWRHWAARGSGPGGTMRSAAVLRGLQHGATGAIAAAPTTSLPERIGGERNWDYRYSWIRDSVFAVRALAQLGFSEEADRFRRFVQRSSAGNVGDLQVLYGIGGERRVDEQDVEGLEGHRGSAPVRTGNGARGQLQLDALGELLGLAWRWHERGNSPDDDTWAFIFDLVDVAAERWREPDAGIWEWRGDPLHFVHSKVACWAAIELGLRLASECGREAPVDRWRAARDAARAAVESDGYDEDRGVFVQAFGSREMDGALLLLPTTGFVEFDDERMVRTVDAVWEELDAGDGLLYRYRRDDGLEGQEGAFLACSFWLAECLARQGRRAEAARVFERAAACGNDLGLFSEEYDPERAEMLGNFPQALTHLAHIGAALALSQT